ncbi:carboxypeptidase regulatory-like domain-containing protein [Nocardioides dokdonensis]|uniref:carboxypeptidase regulatory-like domain-containing protein n=1 Tax=Nocardioides dokdonensis TaxID=450734 RepID=UPI00082C5449|nr:carboxypeptidase regulatory-like domain-containing protein [Nocardioides dokdonensis]
MPFLLLTVIALVVGTFSVPAFAAEVTVAGKVLGRDGAPLQGVTVQLGEKAGPSFDPLVNAASTTDVNGAWSATVNDAAKDEYLVRYTAPGYDVAYYKAGADATTNLDEASRVAITGGRTGLTNKLTRGSAEISGIVSRKGSLEGDKLSAVTVTLTPSTGSGSVQGSATTDAQGAYKIDDVLPGSYTVTFGKSGYRTSYFRSASESTPDRAAATSVVLADKQTRTDVHGFVTDLQRSQMGGIVTTQSGVPIENADIRVYTRRKADGDTGAITDTQVDADGNQTTAVSDATGTDGRWMVDQVFGSYIVQVRAPAFGTYYFDNGSMTTDGSKAAEIKIEEGVVRRLDAKLGNASTTTITGTVDTLNGTTTQPVQGVTVSVETGTTDASGKPVWTEVQTTQAKTRADGSYTANVPPVDSAQYVVGFHAPGFETQYFSAKATQATADKVQATFVTPKTGVDATLKRVAQVIGTVRDNAGNPLQGVDVTPVVYARATKEWVAKPSYAGQAITDKAGRYAVTVENAGLEKPFRLQFSKPGREPRWFPAATVADEGQNLSVAEHEVLSGRDATLPTLAVLAGSLTEADGSTYTQGGKVTLLRKVSYTENGEQGGPAHTEWRPVAEQTLTAGGFSVSVPSGSYRLLATLTNANQGFLPGLVGLDQAPDVTLAPEQSLTVQKYALPSVSAIRGKVTTTTGAPARDKTVTAHYRYVKDIQDGAPVLSGWLKPTDALTASDGSYELKARGRTYRVGVDQGTSKGFYTVDGLSTDTVEDADDIALGTSAVTGIDFGLTDGTPVNLAAPWIAGQAVEGGKLTARPGTWSAADVTYAYQWFHSDNATSGFQPIGGATQETFTIPSRSPLPIMGDFTPKHYKVQVTAIRSTGEISEAANSKPTGKSQASPFYAPADPKTENRQDPQVTGRAAVGETLTGTTGEWSKGGTFELQWLADGQAIAGATASTLVLTAAQLGKQISLKVTETTNDPDSVVVSAATVKVVRGTLRATTLPSVKGQPFIGKPLTADPGTWNAANPSFTYQWLAAGQVLPGATGTTYTPTAADEGKVIAVRVGASVPQGSDPGTATSEATSPVAADPTTVSNRTAPRITGTPRVGETLSTTDGTWTNEPTSFAYQWLADGVAIAGATRSTQQLSDAETGKRITVRVTASKAGLTSGTATSAPTEAVTTGPITNKTLPVISGTAAPGGTLRSSTGTWDPSTGLTFSYQWRADGAPIAGATSPSIVVTESMAGKAVAVAVTATRGAESVTAVSLSRTIDTQAVEPVGVTTGPTVAGRPVVGQELVVDTGVTDPAGATRAVQWLRDAQVIPGAIGTRYLLTSADQGARISARVTYSQEGRGDATRTTTAVGPVGAAVPAGKEKPRVKVAKKTKGSKLVLKVRVQADRVSPVPGKVTLKENRKTLAARTLTDGSTKLVVRGLSKGFHTVRVKFTSGSDEIRNGKKTVSFRIR